MEEQMVPGKQEPAKSQSKTIVIIAAIAVVVLGGVYLAVKNRNAADQTVNPQSAAPVQGVVNGKGEKVFSLSAKPFEFSQKEIRVKKGDTVRINLAVEAGMHDFVVDEFAARTKPLKVGESDSITFVADKVGAFEYYCGLFNHRQMGMVGKLIVE